MFPNDGRPDDRRNFVHKRIIGAVTGFATGGPLGAVGGFIGGGRTLPPQIVPATFARPDICPTGFWRNPQTGQCQPLVTRKKEGAVAGLQRILPGGQTGMVEFGEAVMGQFGAALEPGVREIDARVCPRGTVLGLDGLCYNKGDLKNAERMWPRGRRPLLTGGEMRCISIAASAAKKIQKKTKQLQSMGMLKKPTSRRAPKLLHAHHEHSSHD